MTSYTSSSIRSVRPTIRGSAPNPRRQRPSLMTATVAMPGHLVSRREGPADGGLRSEEVEVVRAGEEHFDALRTLRAGQVRADRPDAGNRFEHAGAPEVIELRLRQPDVAHPERLVVGRDPHERRGIGKGQRLQQHAVHDGVDGRRRSDADGQRARGGNREQGVPAHPPQREPHVLQHLTLLRPASGCSAYASWLGSQIGRIRSEPARAPSGSGTACPKAVTQVERVTG